MNKIYTKYFIALILSSILYSCSFGPYYRSSVKNWKTTATPDSTRLYYSVFLIGDAGGPSLNEQEPVLKLLQSQIEKDSNSALVFLGDNIYFDGLPPETDNGRAQAEKKINESLKIINNYKGEAYFIAGNHDWDKMKQDGLARIRFQEEYIEAYLNRGNTFVPDNGCPGPYLIKTNSNVVIIAVDSQWWLQKYEKPYGRCGDCTADDERDFLIQLEDFIKTNRNKNIILVAHHPLLSNGNHGGYYNILDHIFPLRLIHSKWLLPLPAIGSIYPLYRKFGGVDQDIPNYRYQEYIDEVVKIIKKYDNVVYAAGHEHNLQFHQTEKLNHVVSGSGSKMTPLKGGGDALFTFKKNGFAILRYYKNGQTFIEYWAPEGEGSRGEMVFRHQVYTRKTGAPESYCSLSAIDYTDSTNIQSPTDKYEKNNLPRFLLGNHYREAWTTPIKTPLIDLKTEQGGLIPYAIGGGKQTISLKLKNLDEREFILRLINKNPTQRIPLDLRNALLNDIIDDQISAQHPYGAVAIPPMEKALGIYHTNPKIVLIPNDSCLGPYREQLQNSMALFEENPDGNHENSPSLGYASKIVGTDRMREKLESDNDNKVDERNFLKARMLDNVIGDWDRHEQQYRWNVTLTSKGEIYRPIPEDRDQVFFKFDGIIPFFLHRKWAIRNLQDFDKKYNDVIGLNLSAKNIDRRYLSSLSKEDWKQIADSIKKELSDSIIEISIKNFPADIYSLNGEEIISKLKSRRDRVPEAMLIYYKALAKYVDVFASDKDEKFTVTRLNNKNTKVIIEKVNKDGDSSKKIFERTFNSQETKEIRLYGLGGEDKFLVTGNAKKGIKIRIIGGSGSDTLKNTSAITNGVSKKTIFYDTDKDNVILEKSETKLTLSPEESINYPSADQFFYRYKGPRIGLGFNPDDGFYMGVGIVLKNYRFRSNPYGSEHTLYISRAFGTGSMKIEYYSDIRKFIKNYDLGINFNFYAPNNVINYFGYGNQSQQTSKNINFYRVHVKQLNFNPVLKKDLKKFITVGIGPRFQYYELMQRSNTFIELTSINSEFYRSKFYLGLRGFFRIGTKDNTTNPTRGIELKGEVNENRRLDKTGSYRQLSTAFSFYISPNLPYQLTIATRFGYDANWGQFDFYQANALGGVNSIGESGNLRGARKFRYVGDKIIYSNIDVRLQIVKFNTYVFTSKVGILGFLDNGKAFVTNQQNGGWHTSYGGGLWTAFFNKFILTGTYGISNDDKLFVLKTGFLF